MAALATSLVTCLFYVSTQLPHVSAATTAAPNDTATTATDPGEFGIVVIHEESDTSKISITWTVNDAGHDVESFIVESRKTDGKDKIVSPPLNGSVRGYVVEDLRTNTEYQICLKPSVESKPDAQPECEVFKTLATIRKDSILVLLLVLGYLLLMIIIGIICWK